MYSIHTLRVIVMYYFFKEVEKRTTREGINHYDMVMCIRYNYITSHTRMQTIHSIDMIRN